MARQEVYRHSATSRAARSYDAAPRGGASPKATYDLGTVSTTAPLPVVISSVLCQTKVYFGDSELY